jgi:hypothetical protein
MAAAGISFGGASLTLPWALILMPETLVLTCAKKAFRRSRTSIEGPKLPTQTSHLRVNWIPRSDGALRQSNFPSGAVPVALCIAVQGNS